LAHRNTNAHYRPFQRLGLFVTAYRKATLHHIQNRYYQISLITLESISQTSRELFHSTDSTIKTVNSRIRQSKYLFYNFWK